MSKGIVACSSYCSNPKRKLRLPTTVDSGLPIPPQNRPKHILSAWNAFVKDNLPTFKNQIDPAGTEGRAGMAKALKACSGAWKDLPASEEQKYLDDASKRLQESKVAYDAYLSQITPRDFKRLNEILPVSSRLIRPRGSSRLDVVRRPASAFSLFFKDHMVRPGGPNMAQQTSELAVKWRAMSADEKEVSDILGLSLPFLSRFMVLINLHSLT